MFKFDRATKEEMALVGKKGAKQKWPMPEMHVGDAITITQGEYGASNVSTYPHIYGKMSGKKFSCRKVSEGVYRIIRIS